METPEKRGTPAQGNNPNSELIEKLKERRGYGRRKYLLAQKGSIEESFWRGYVEGLAVAILIVECDE